MTRRGFSMSELEPDWHQATALAVYAMWAHMNSTAATPPPNPATFKQSRARLWVNGLWVASLALALIVALLAILVRQWLVEYRSRNRAVVQSQKRWAWRHMVYRDALDYWRIEDIIAILPVIPHVALFLFLAGLSIFLAATHLGLAALVLILTGAAAFYYAVATFLPLWAGDCPTVTPLLRLLFDDWQMIKAAMHLPWQQSAPPFHEAILIGPDERGRTIRVLDRMLHTLVDAQEITATLIALGSLPGEASDSDAVVDNSRFEPWIRRIVSDHLEHILGRPSNLHAMDAAGILRLQARWNSPTFPRDTQWNLLRQYDGQILLGASAAARPDGLEQVQQLAHQLDSWFSKHHDPPYLASTRDVAFKHLTGWHYRLVRWDFVALFILSITEKSVTPGAEEILALVKRRMDDPAQSSSTPVAMKWKVTALNVLSWRLSNPLKHTRSSSCERNLLHRAYEHVLSQVTAAEAGSIWPDLTTFLACVTYMASTEFAAKLVSDHAGGSSGVAEILRQAAGRTWKQPDEEQTRWQWNPKLVKLYTMALGALSASRAQDSWELVLAIARAAFDTNNGIYRTPIEPQPCTRASVVNLIEPFDCGGVHTSLWIVTASTIPHGNQQAEADLCAIIGNIARVLRLLRRSDPTRSARLVSEVLKDDHVKRSLKAAIWAGSEAHNKCAVNTAADLADLTPAHWHDLKEQIRTADWSSHPESRFGTAESFLGAVEAIRRLGYLPQ